MDDSVLENQTLMRAISFIKFNCIDTESRYLAASPILGKILQKLIEDMNLKYENRISLNLERAGPTFNLVYHGVKKNLERTIEWTDMEKSDKLNHIKNLASPYILSDDMVVELFDYAENQHR
ncbi:hypothetical protein [Flagellimonas sp.]|uniref:hypothetical protein n=1 Tax=Flagellimonas sp. TaxID=2058762 RepID=UPI003AB80A59